MYFFLSKTIGLLAVPSNDIALVLILGLLLWRTRYGKRTTVAEILLLLIAGASRLGTALLLPLENCFPQRHAAQGAPDGIVVLGGIINVYISNQRHDIAFGPSVGRLMAGLDLARQYPAARIVFSGGDPNLIFPGSAEADVAGGFLERSGVPSDHIVLDRTSRNMTENAANAKKLAAPKPGERWLLITSASHMPRAIGLFRAAGFPVEAYPIDFKTGGWHDVFEIPRSFLGQIGALNVATHEWVGLFGDWTFGRSSALFPAPADTNASE